MSQTLLQGSEIEGLLLDPSCSPSRMTSLYQECLALRSEVSELKSALEQEQSRRRNLERECAIEQERAAKYNRERQDYKQRLKEAAVAYSQIKEAYHRLNSADPATRAVLGMTSVAETPCETPFAAHGCPTQAIPIGQRSKGMPLLSQQIPSWQRVSDLVSLASPVPADNSSPLIAVPPPVRTNEPQRSPDFEKIHPVRISPPSNEAQDPRQPVVAHRAGWKKAVRRSGNKDNNSINFIEDASMLPRSTKRQQPRDDAYDEDNEAAFMEPPIKRHVPDVSYIAQPPPSPQARPTSGGAAGRSNVISVADRNKEDITNMDNPTTKGFKHQSVVRQKEDRAKLQGFECEDCKRFYDALERWGAVAIGGLPECQHHNGAVGIQGQRQAGVEHTRVELRGEVSRHRYLYEPPLTPNGFWDLGFDTPPDNQPSEDTNTI